MSILLTKYKLIGMLILMTNCLEYYFQIENGDTKGSHTWFKGIIIKDIEACRNERGLTYTSVLHVHPT